MRHQLSVVARLLVATIVGSAAALPADGGIYGKVLDRATGEPLRKVLVALQGTEYQAISADDGFYKIDGVPAGTYTLYVSSIGYRLLKKDIRLEEGCPQEVLLYLGQEASTVSDVVHVTAPVFEEVEKAAACQITMNSSEIKNLAGVLIDDPLRSVQTLPGVASDDDFHSYYSVRGGGYSNNGIMVDGVLTHRLAHTIQGTSEPTGSVTILNGDIVESMALYTGAFSPKYGDRTASFLDVVTREGSRDRLHSRLAVSGSNAALVAEGPTGKDRRGSWIISTRKSYADYLVRKISKESDLNLGFSDVQAKAAEDLTIHHRLGAGVTWGRAIFSRDPGKRGPNSLIWGSSNVGVGNIFWTWLPSSRLLLDARLYLIRETYENKNRDKEIIGHGEYTELAVRSDLSLQLSPAHRLETGFLGRYTDDRAVDRRFDYGVRQFLEVNSLRGRYRQNAMYAQDRWEIVGGRLVSILGFRLEDTGLTGQAVVNPRASIEWRLGRRDRIDAGWGIHTQLPEARYALGRNGNQEIRGELSRHYVVGYERQLGEMGRLRLDSYMKRDSNLLRSRENLFRLEDGEVTPPNPDFRYDNALRGASHGFEIFLQRRSANRVSGWVSYAYARTRRRDLVRGETYPGEFDQAHTMNVYGSYRLSQSWNLSLKARFGSGFPYPGYFDRIGPDYYLGTERNRERLPYYGRIDMRLNKAFFFTRSKLSLYLEVLNVLNRENIRFEQIYSVGRSEDR